MPLGRPVKNITVQDEARSKRRCYILCLQMHKPTITARVLPKIWKAKLQRRHSHEDSQDGHVDAEGEEGSPLSSPGFAFGESCSHVGPKASICCTAAQNGCPGAVGVEKAMGVAD